MLIKQNMWFRHGDKNTNTDKMILFKEGYKNMNQHKSQKEGQKINYNDTIQIDKRKNSHMVTDISTLYLK